MPHEIFKDLSSTGESEPLLKHDWVAWQEEKVPRIFLIRHGRVNINQAERISGSALSSWVDRYDQAGISASVRPPPPVVEVLREADLIVCSDRRRAIDSIALIAPNADVLEDPEYREAELPAAFHSPIRLRADWWVALARAAWFAGWAPNCESVKDVRGRAARAAMKLLRLALDRRSIAVVGHGVFNRFIGRALRREGVLGPRFAPTNPWGLAKYRVKSRQLPGSPAGANVRPMPSDIQSLQIQPSTGTLTVGTAIQLALTALTRSGRSTLIPGNSATWSSSNQAVAEVTRQGRVQPRTPGSVTVTASHSKLTAQAAFTVVA